MAKLTIFLQEEGWPNIQSKLRKMDAVWGEPIRAGLVELGAIGEGALMSRVPRGESNVLAGSIKAKLPSAPIPMWVKWTANASKRGQGKGGRYGYVLNVGHRRSKRGGIFPVGQSAGWFSGAKPVIASALTGVASKIAQGIERLWQR